MTETSSLDGLWKSFKLLSKNNLLTNTNDNIIDKLIIVPKKQKKVRDVSILLLEENAENAKDVKDEDEDENAKDAKEDDEDEEDDKDNNEEDEKEVLIDLPFKTELNISTKSKIAYLNITDIDLKKIFWLIYINPYNKVTEEIVVIKKQIKYVSKNEEELTSMKKLIENELYYDEQIIVSINNPTGRIKFKDIRKLSVGLSKKDIINNRIKKKAAFFNCIVLILRYKLDNFYKECHIKIFNTGRLKILGAQNEEVFQSILKFLTLTLQPLLQPFNEIILSINTATHTILTNSNFNCGFSIDQDTLFNILKTKYKIQSIYDPTMYPGIQCKFYHDINKDDMSGQQTNNMTVKQNKKSNDHSVVSFMIFSSGNILIIGKMSDELLYSVYNFIKKILHDEYNKICIKPHDKIPIKNKNKKVQKKTINSISAAIETNI